MRASSVLPGMAQPNRAARGMSLSRHEVVGGDKPGMAPSSSQGAIAVSAGTAPGGSLGSAAPGGSLGSAYGGPGASAAVATGPAVVGGGPGSASAAAGVSTAVAAGMWPHSPEPRMRAAWQGLPITPVATSMKPPTAAPLRDPGPSLGGASLGGILAAGAKPASSEEHSSARGRVGSGKTPGVNGGSGSFAVAHGSPDGGDATTAATAAKVVRQISMPSSRHELAGAPGGPRPAQVQASAQPPGGLPGPPRHLAASVFGAESAPSAATAQSYGSEMLPTAAVPSMRPPPQVVGAYSARAGQPARHGQPYVFTTNVAEAVQDPSSGRSPARVRPTVQVMPGNRSPARSRPNPSFQPSAIMAEMHAVGTHSPPYQSAGLPVVGSSVGAAQSALAGPALLSAAAEVALSREEAGQAVSSGSATYPPPSVASVPAAPMAYFEGGYAAAEVPQQLENDREKTMDDDMDLYGPPGQNRPENIVQEVPCPLAKGQLTAEERIGYTDLEFVEHIGSGEFGQVFRGFYRGKEVAIKQLYWDDTVLPEVIIQDLTREIESFRHLRHKRLVSFIGACLEIPNLCLVTEYMPGGSLHHLLHIVKLRLPLLHCINMCLQLADGVTYLHSQQPLVVHRDLKSLNVVLDLNLNLKLCDFGLTESMDRTHITKKNNGGSPRYMAPELFDNKSKITEKVDIWSMGCIFTEIFGGPLPYEGINTLADLTREMLVNRRMPTIPSHLPEPIQNIIRSCYNFDARLRPSAKQVFDQLRDVKKRLRMQGALPSS